MKTAYAYARFSSDNQREESIDAQVRAISEYCEKNDIVILRIFKDEAFSARTDKRPAFQDMFSLISEKPADFVIVHKLDRFARNRFDAAIYRSKLKEAGMTLVSVLERFDDSPESIILEGMLEAMNEYYSANLSRETKKGLKENILQGKRNGGRVPMGYRVVDHKLVPDGNAPRVKKCFEMYANNKTYQEMTEATGIPRHVIKWMLMNEAYIGNLVQGENRCNNAHEPIIDMPTWEAVRRRMGQHDFNASGKQKHHYMLSRLLVCGRCGRNMVGCTSGDAGRHYYSCKQLGHKYWREEDLERRVIKDLSNALRPTDDLKARIYELALRGISNQEAIEKAMKANYNRQQAIDRIIDSMAYAQSAEDARKMVEKVNQIRSEMEEVPEPMSNISRDQTDAFCESFFDIDTKTKDEQETILRKAVKKIVVYDDRLVLLTDTLKEVRVSVNHEGILA